MEFQYISFVISASLFGIFVFHFFTTRKRDRKAPEVAGAWPVLGHLHLLGSSDLLIHRYLASLADIYGPVFIIRLGLKRAVVVNDSELAKQCFTTNDKAFANRPKSMAADLMGYNYANFGFASYGPYFNAVRKTVVLELLSDRRLCRLGHIRVSEVKESVKDAYLFWLNNEKNTTGHVKIDLTEWTGSLLLNIVVKMIVGKRFSPEEGEEAARQKSVIKRFFILLGSFVVSDFVPFLSFLDLGGYKKKMTNIAKEMDQIVEGWLTEHRASRSTRSADENYEDTDFMDVMLSTIDKNRKDFASFDADAIIKSTCGALLIGGTNTTTEKITWALALLLNNPDVLERAQREVDKNVGKEREVEESDVKNLVYIQAIVKETLRLYGGGIFPRESRESCNLGGYDIPKGTLLMVNAWKIHRDPETWLDPLKFEPERFLTTHKDVDLRGQHFELLPFGSGRRMCPGVSQALQVVEFVLARLIHSFDLSPPTDEPTDMTECFSVGLGRATPLQGIAQTAFIY